MDIEKIKANPRYSDFTYLDAPVMFDEFFKDKDYDVVQIQDINPISEIYPDPIGFAGQFEWKSNEITSLDGDSYTKDMPVHGYKEYTSNDGEKCVDILTDKW